MTKAWMARPAVAWLACLLVVGSTFPIPAASAQAPRSYTRTIATAVEEFELGHWEEARTLFRQAHAIKPNARTLRGLGMVEYEMRHYADAAHHLEASLSDPREALTPEMQGQVRELLARARSFIGRVTVVLEPPDAAVMLDGAPLQVGDEPIELNAGEHTFVATASGYARLERVVDLRGSEEMTVELTLQPDLAVSAVPGEQGSAALTTADGEPRDDDGGLLGKWWFWTGVGVVTAGVVVAVLAASGGDGGQETRPVEEGDIGGVVTALEAR